MKNPHPSIAFFFVLTFFFVCTMAVRNALAQEPFAQDKLKVPAVEHEERVRAVSSTKTDAQEPKTSVSKDSARQGDAEGARNTLPSSQEVRHMLGLAAAKEEDDAAQRLFEEAHSEPDGLPPKMLDVPEFGTLEPEAVEPEAVEPEVLESQPGLATKSGVQEVLSMDMPKANLWYEVLDSVMEASMKPAYDMSPLIADESWGQVLALYEAGDCHKALLNASDLFPDEAKRSDAQRYAFARLMHCDGQKTRAKEVFLKLISASKEKTIKQLAMHELGQVPHTKSFFSDFWAAFKKVKEDVRHKRFSDAHTALDELLRDPGLRTSQRINVLAMKLSLLERAKRLHEASDVWRGMWHLSLKHKRAYALEKDIMAFERRHKRKVLSQGDRIDWVRALVLKRRYKKALKVAAHVADRLGFKGKAHEGWRLYVKGLVAERKRDRPKAVDYFERAQKHVDDAALHVRMYMAWARALRRMHRDTEAIALYDRVCAKHPHEALCEEAYYQAGRLLQYDRKHKEARKRFFMLAAEFPHGVRVPDALWRFAFSAYMQKDWDQAVAALTHIIDFYPDEKDASELTLGLKARYWLGATLFGRGDKIKAHMALQNTINHGPLTWYGRLAAARLERMGVQPLHPLPSRVLSSAHLDRLDHLHVPRDPHLDYAVGLIRTGFLSEGMRHVQRNMYKVKDRRGAKSLLAALYLKMGRADKAHWMMKKVLGQGGPNGRNLRNWGTAFPPKFMDHAHTFGAKFGVSPFLVQAIIRQESGFRKSAVSPVGALGLMQVMPRTAQYAERILTDTKKKWSKKELFEPQNNVRLGSMYIRVVLAFASERIALALAGYNAGPRPLKRWFREYGDRELDAWVESITYREARGYVRKVFTSYVAYSALYGGALPRLSLDLPKRLGTWGVVPEKKDEAHNLNAMIDVFKLKHAPAKVRKALASRD